MYETHEEKDRKVDGLGRGGDYCSRCGFLCGGQRYTDKWGEVWTRTDCCHVRRNRDGNVGGFFDGKGLTFTS